MKPYSIDFRQKIIEGEQLITLIEIIESNNDATLEELCELLQEKTGITVSRSTMGRVTLQLNYTLKKNSPCSRKRKRSRSKKAS